MKITTRQDNVVTIENYLADAYTIEYTDSSDETQTLEVPNALWF